MTLRRASSAVIVISLVYLIAAGLMHDGLKAQPHLVLAWDVEDFAAELQAAGGPGAVRNGIMLDMVFIVAFTGAALVLLRTAGMSRWWLLPGAYALFDTVENAVTWYLVDTDPESGMLHALAAIAALKFLFFGATFVALVAAWRRVDPAARGS